MRSRYNFTVLFVSTLAVLCLGLGSCHKDLTNSGPLLVKSMTIDGNGCVINCLYDDQDRVTTVTQCDTVETYTYFADSVVYVHSVSNAAAYRDIYALDSKGMATGYKHIASDGSVTLYSLSYDADGNRLRNTDITHANTFVIYNIQNGNAVYDTAASSYISSGNYTILRTFYANTENTLSYANFGKSFLGNSSANFKKTEVYNGSNAQYSYTYRYELNYRNGVSRRTTLMNDSIVVEARDYEYYGGD